MADVEVTYISPADRGNIHLGSFNRQLTVLGDKAFGYWCGYGELNPGILQASLNVITPSQQRGIENKKILRLPKKAFITSVAFQPLGDITLSAAGGFLKFSHSLTEDGVDLLSQNVFSDPAVGTLLAKPEESFLKDFPFSAAKINSLLISTWRIYATDASGIAAATMSVRKKTKVLAAIGFYVPAPFPSEGEVGFAAPEEV